MVSLIFCLTSPDALAQSRDKDKERGRGEYVAYRRKLSPIISAKLELSCLQLTDSTKSARKVPLGGTAWETTDLKDWTSGFYPGLLFYWDQTPGIIRQENRILTVLEPNQYIKWTHDLGFMMYDSFWPRYQQTKDAHTKEVLVQSAKSLASLYNPKVGTIMSWTWKKAWQHPTIIDNMMNLELLFQATRLSGDSSFHNIAVHHARTTQKEHFRPDMSTYHVVIYDTITGKAYKKVTAQGANDSSMWARGQAWAIYGFGLAYEYTGDTSFLTTSRKAAALFMDKLPSDKVPYWDFNVIPDKGTPRDASAAAIASAGMLRLANLKSLSDTDKKFYLENGLKLFRALSKPPYLNTNKLAPQILDHSTGSKPHNSEVDVALIYADYYYLEAFRAFGLHYAPELVKQ